MIVAFSGFKDGGDANYSNAAKEQLVQIVISLGGEIRNEAEFDSKITHIVTPPHCRTMKTLAGALTHRWYIKQGSYQFFRLVSANWVIDSEEAQEFVAENRF